MVITYHDGGCFRVQSGSSSLAIDPPNERLKPDILIRTSVPFPAPKPGAREIVGPGEYEIGEISIKGHEVRRESSEKLVKSIYSVRVEDVALGFLGELFNAPDDELVEALGEVDILFVPVGPKPYLDAETAAKVAKKINPKMVVPSHGKNLKEFFEEMGQKVSAEDRLTIKKKDLIEWPGATKVVWLNS